MLLRINFINWSIIEKYFRMNFRSSSSAKNDLCNLLSKVRFESLFIYFFRLLLRLLAVLSGTLTIGNRDMSSTDNFEDYIVDYQINH